MFLLLLEFQSWVQDLQFFVSSHSSAKFKTYCFFSPSPIAAACQPVNLSVVHQLVTFHTSLFAIDKYKHEMHFQINQPQLDPNLTLPTCSGEALQLSVACCNTFCGSWKSPNSMAIYQKIICNILLAMLDVAWNLHKINAVSLTAGDHWPCHARPCRTVPYHAIPCHTLPARSFKYFS